MHAYRIKINIVTRFTVRLGLAKRYTLHNNYYDEAIKYGSVPWGYRGCKMYTQESRV